MALALSATEAYNVQSWGNDVSGHLNWALGMLWNVGRTITYPEMEHLAKLLHHAIKTALFPLFFLPSCN